MLNGIQKQRDRYYNYYSYYRNDWNADKGRGGVMAGLKARIINML